MDELFERFKNAHPKHRYLFLGLVITEIFGIFILVWYLKEPLRKQFLISPPKAYSVESYNTQKRYLVKQGDFLRGTKALPFSKIAVFITPGNSKIIVKADKQGNFSFQIPENSKTGKYRLTFANYDALKKIAWIKSYKVTIDSNSIFKEWRLKLARAKEN